MHPKASSSVRAPVDAETFVVFMLKSLNVCVGIFILQNFLYLYAVVRRPLVLGAPPLVTCLAPCSC